MSTILAVKYNIELYRRQDFIKKFTHTDPSGTPTNFNGWSFASHIYNFERSKKYTEMSVVNSNVLTGEITMSLTDTQTTILPDLSYYDIRVTYGTTSYYILSGTITAYQGYTA